MSPQCENCGSHVNEAFGRVYGGQDDEPELQETRVGMWFKDDSDGYSVHSGRGETHLSNTEIEEHGWLGTPYPFDEYSREKSIARYTKNLLDRADEDPDFAKALIKCVHGRVLGCYCRSIEDDQDDCPRCHAHVIADVADRLAAKRRSQR